MEKAQDNFTDGLITGVFDVIHQGHREFLTAAQEKVDQLWIGIEPDKRVKAAKGASRPVHGQNDRAERVKKLVPAAIVFVLRRDFGDPAVRKRLFKIIKPKYLIVGEFDPRLKIKQQTIESCGGQLLVIKENTLVSTTRIMTDPQLETKLVFEDDKKKHPWRR